jgi:hypothetical protein
VEAHKFSGQKALPMATADSEQRNFPPVLSVPSQLLYTFSNGLWKYILCHFPNKPYNSSFFSLIVTFKIFYHVLECCGDSIEWSMQNKHFVVYPKELCPFKSGKCFKTHHLHNNNWVNDSPVCAASKLLQNFMIHNRLFPWKLVWFKIYYSKVHCI